MYATRYNIIMRILCVNIPRNEISLLRHIGDASRDTFGVAGYKGMSTYYAGPVPEDIREYIQYESANCVYTTHSGVHTTKTCSELYYK